MTWVRNNSRANTHETNTRAHLHNKNIKRLLCEEKLDKSHIFEHYEPLGFIVKVYDGFL